MAERTSTGASDQRTTYVLLRFEPRRWVEELYDFVLGQVLPAAEVAAIEARGLGKFDEAEAISALKVRAEDHESAQRGLVHLDPKQDRDAALFRDAAIATAKGRLSVSAERGQNALFTTSLTGNQMSVALTAIEQRALAAWVVAHGDAFEDVFRREDRLAPRLVKRGVHMKPGEDAVLSAQELADELSGSWIATRPLVPVGEGDDSKLTVTGRVQRLVPGSGRLGRMGRFDVTIEVESPGSIEVEDDQGLDAALVATAHYDPACQRLYLGGPAFGNLTIETPSPEYHLAIAPAPSMIRKWRKWHPAPEAEPPA